MKRMMNHIPLPQSPLPLTELLLLVPFFAFMILAG